ncbi:MAG: hypothetical protein OXC91_00720 [Rhodobacteraceae bacterium]|nr:hypothetical protein [Paracoccaceae bacterium]
MAIEIVTQKAGARGYTAFLYDDGVLLVNGGGRTTNSAVRDAVKRYLGKYIVQVDAEGES